MLIGAVLNGRELEEVVKVPGGGLVVQAEDSDERLELVSVVAGESSLKPARFRSVAGGKNTPGSPPRACDFRWRPGGGPMIKSCGS